jgi:hypothetical protein
MIDMTQEQQQTAHSEQNSALQQEQQKESEEELRCKGNLHRSISTNNNHNAIKT